MKYKDDYDGSTPLVDKRQESFVLEYIKGHYNKRGAAIQAGYSKGSAGISASRALNYKHVKLRIKYLEELVTNNEVISIEYIIQGIKEIADDGNAKDSDKLKAYELLGRHKAMFTDNKVIEVKPRRVVIRNEEGQVKEEIK